MYMEAGVANKVDRHAMVATNKSKHKGIIDMPAIVLNPPQAGVKVALEMDTQRTTQNVGIAAERVTRERWLEKVCRFRKIRFRQSRTRKSPKVGILCSRGSKPNQFETGPFQNF